MSLTIVPHVLTILLVDDKPRALLPQKKRIIGYLPAHITLNWMDDKGDNKGKGVFEKLSKNNVDILLLDNNINSGISGLDILKIVRKRHDLTDIIFYSAAEEHKENFAEANNFRFTEVVIGRDIADVLEELIDKNLMKWDNIVFLRGMVISKIIELELKINEIFATYFSIAVAHIENFRNLVMESGQNSLDIKRRALMIILHHEKLTDKFKGFSNLSDLQTSRNLLAHSKLKQNEKNTLTANYMGKPIDFDKTELYKIVSKINKMQELADNLIYTITTSRKKAVRD